jgi:hypothetical protein
VTVRWSIVFAAACSGALFVKWVSLGLPTSAKDFQLRVPLWGRSVAAAAACNAGPVLWWLVTGRSIPGGYAPFAGLVLASILVECFARSKPADLPR